MTAKADSLQDSLPGEISERTWRLSAAAILIAVDGIGRMGAGIFPCDPGCVQVSPGPDLHRLFATIGFSSGIAAAIVWGFVMRGVSPLRSLSSFSVWSGVVALVSLLLMSGTRSPALPQGLLEHLATAVLSVWLLVFASRLAWVEKTSPVNGPSVDTPSR